MGYLSRRYNYYNYYGRYGCCSPYDYRYYNPYDFYGDRYGPWNYL